MLPTSRAWAVGNHHQERLILATIRGAPAGSLSVTLLEHEAALIRGLAAEMRAILAARDARGSPVIARLYPDAYEEDDDSQAFRLLVEDDLTKAKLEAVELVENKLGRSDEESSLLLSYEETNLWLTFLTDARLALGTRLEVDEDRMSAEIEDDDPDAAALSVLHWLGWLQETTLDQWET